MARRAGLYLRISKDRDGSGLAVDRQREDGRALIKARGWDFAGEYVDNDISAAGRKKRADFLRLLGDVRDGRIDIVVSERWDRLSRNRRDDLAIVETCQPHGTLIALMRGADIDLTSAAGRLFADMVSGFARHEIDLKSERQVRQARQAAELGLPGSIGRRAFGYAADGLERDPVESMIVRQLYDRWLTGEGLGSLARWLNERSMRTPQGNPWRSGAVREVLANPRNAGLRGIREVVNPKTGTRAQWHRIVGPAVWPEIVSEETWRAALARIKDDRRPGAHVGSGRLRYLLPGIALCGVGRDGEKVEAHDPDFDRKVCGRPLVTGRRRPTERTLRCPSLRHVSRRADYIEAHVEEALIEWLRQEGAPPVAAPVDGNVDLGSLRSESIELRSRLEGLARDYADLVLDREQVRAAGERLRLRLHEIDDEVARAGQVDVVAPLRAAADPSAAWDAYPLVTQREVLRQVTTVHVLGGSPGRPGGLRFHPESVRIAWRE